MKERIAEAAFAEILQRGLRFSMRDLANRLGISTKTLYTWFASKEEIVAYLVDSSIREMKEAEQAIMDKDLPLLRKLRLALVNLPQGAAFGQIHLLEELYKLYPDQWRTVDEYLNQGWEAIRVLLREGMAAGVLRPFDVELFIQVYVGAMYRLMDRNVLTDRRLTLEGALSETVDFLLEGITRPAASDEKGE